jgi:putative FmdB family regulatory protein
MLYEYVCEDCGNEQEEIHGMKESPIITCEYCKCKNMHKVITGGSGFILKGDGWTSSNARFKQSMIKKSEKAGKKAKDHVQPVTSISDLHKV